MDFVTIATFSSYFDAVPPKSLLESEGITCYLKDENSVTINPVLTNSIGGIKLQVPEKDYTRAAAILTEGGYNIVEYDNQLPTGWQRFDALTRKLPVIGKLNLLFRALSILVIASLILILIFFKINQPKTIADSLSTYDKVTSNRWCVAFIKHKNEEIKLRTTGIRLVMGNEDTCNEAITFFDQTITLPGINTTEVNATGRFDKNKEKLVITETDTFQSIYEGVYTVQKDYNQLVLTSEHTVIYCTIPVASSLSAE